MDNRITYLIRKASYKNSPCEKDAECVFDQSINFYNSLLLKGYDVNTALKVVLRRIKSRTIIITNEEPNKYRTSVINISFILIVLALINCIIYFNDLLDFNDIIFVDLIFINVVTLFKSRKVFKNKNKNSNKELKGLLFTMIINLLVTLLLKYDLSLREFHSRVGYMLLIGNILYIVLFNKSRLILFLSIPSALISVMLIDQSISLVNYMESILFVYVAYLIYSALTIKFIYSHNLLLGFFSIVWSFILYLFNINYSSLILFSIAFMIISVIIIKLVTNEIYLNDYKSIITFNILSILGFLAISTMNGYINEASNIKDIYLFDQKTLIFVLFLVSLEVANVIVFTRLKIIKTIKVLN